MSLNVRNFSYFFRFTKIVLSYNFSMIIMALVKSTFHHIQHRSSGLYLSTSPLLDVMQVNKIIQLEKENITL